MTVSAETTASSEDVYALARRVSELRVEGRYEEARYTAAAALELANWGLPADPVPTAVVRNEMGVLLKALGEYDLALSHYLAALPVLTDAFGETSDEVATICHNLAGIHFVRDDLAQAEEWGRRGLAIRRRVSGSDHIDVIYDLANLAPVLIQRGKNAEAREVLDLVVARLEGELGPAHYEVSVALTNLGALEAREGRWEQARIQLARAAEIKRAVLGPANPELIRTLANLAVVIAEVGDLEAATRTASEAIGIARNCLSASHPTRLALEAAYPTL